MSQKRIFLLVIGFCFLLIFVNNQLVEADTLRPLITEDANVLKPGELKLRLGIEYLEDKNLLFDPQNSSRDVFILPSLDIFLGVSKIAEIQAYIDGLYVDEEGYNSAYGVGDLSLFTKIRLKEEDDFAACGFKFGVKLPTASDEDRLGTDETDFYSWFLFSKHFGDTSCHLNLGIGILSDPNQNSSQDDVFSYGLGFIIPATDTINLAVEVNGQAGSNENNDFSHALLGLQIERETIRWDIGASVGLSDESQDWSIKCGLTKSFESFIEL